MQVSGLSNQSFGKIYYTQKAKQCLYEQFHRSPMNDDIREYWRDLYKKANASKEYDIYLTNSGVARVINKKTKKEESTHYGQNHMESLGSAIKAVARQVHFIEL